MFASCHICQVRMMMSFNCGASLKSSVLKCQTGPSGQTRETHEDPHRRQLVEAGEEFVEGHDQLLSRALRGQAGETLDVCKQNAEDEKTKTKKRFGSFPIESEQSSHSSGRNTLRC